jgi:hypothetical protein
MMTILDKIHTLNLGKLSCLYTYMVSLAIRLLKYNRYNIIMNLTI